MSGEIVALAMSEDEAMQRIGRVKVNLTDAKHDLIELHHRRAWVSLGLKSWDALCDVHFGGVRISLPPGDRREIVAEMTDAGMSTRAIGLALGVSKDTINRDQATVSNETVRTVQSLDGKIRTVSAVEEIVQSDPEVRAAKLRHRVAQWLYNINQSHLYDPVELARIYPERKEDVERDRQEFNRWCDSYLAELSNPLRLIENG